MVWWVSFAWFVFCGFCFGLGFTTQVEVPGRPDFRLLRRRGTYPRVFVLEVPRKALFLFLSILQMKFPIAFLLFSVIQVVPMNTGRCVGLMKSSSSPARRGDRPGRSSPQTTSGQPASPLPVEFPRYCCRLRRTSFWLGSGCYTGLTAPIGEPGNALTPPERVRLGSDLGQTTGQLLATSPVGGQKIFSLLAGTCSQVLPWWSIRVGINSLDLFAP